MPTEIWKVTAADRLHLENCREWSFKELTENNQLEVLDGAGILDIVKEVRRIKTEAARGTHYFTLEELTAADIDDYLAHK